MDILEILENHEARLRRLTKNLEELIINGTGGLQIFNSTGDFPNPGEDGFIYLDSSTGISYYWDGTQYLPFTDVDSFIQNQNAVNQSANFRIQGTGTIVSAGTPTMEWTQTFGAGYGVYIPFHTSTIPVGYFSLGDSGLSYALLNVSVPSTNSSFAVTNYSIELDGFLNQAFAQVSLLRINDLLFFKNYNNNLLHDAGQDTIGIYDSALAAYRLLIRPNGNWLVGLDSAVPPVDNGARFQVYGGPLSLMNSPTDYAGGNGFIFYRSDTGRFRVFMSGLWKDLATLDDITAGGGSAVTSFNTRIGAIMPQIGDYDKTLVGLGNVDNTSDANKPISIAQAAGLIQNQTAAPQTAGFNINGPGTLGGKLAVNMSGSGTYPLEVVGNVQGGVPSISNGISFGWNKSSGSGEVNITWSSNSGTSKHLEFGFWDGATYTPVAFLGPTGGLNIKGILALASVVADLPGVNGSLEYRNDIHKLRAFINGAWKDVATEDDLALKAGITNTKFIPSSPYTVLPADDGQILVWGTSGPLTINVATGLRNGWQCEIWQDSDDPITFADAGGAVVHSRGELKTTAGKYAGVTLCHLAGGQFRLAGDIV